MATTIVSEEGLNSVLMLIVIALSNKGVSLLETNLYEAVGILVLSVILLLVRAYMQKNQIDIGSIGREN